MRKILLLLLVLTPMSAQACQGFEHTMQALEMTLASAEAVQAPQDPTNTVIEKSWNGVEAVFKTEFASRQELEKWATGSTLGGGRVDTLNFHGAELALAFRSYTSGVRSSDIGVYQKKGAGYILIKSHPPIWKSWVKVDLVHDKVIFRSEDIKSKPLLTLTKADLR